MSVTFKDFLKRRRRSNTPQGDFVHDALRDPYLPDARSWEALHAYLLWRGADGEC